MPIACQSGEGLTGVCHVFTLQKYYFFVGERYEYRKTCVASDILSLFLCEDVILRFADGHWVKRAFAVRLSNWQFIEGAREAAPCGDHGGVMCAQCCVSVTPRCVPIPELNVRTCGT